MSDLLTAYKVITFYPLPQNIGNLTLPFFGGDYPIVLLDNIYYLFYIYINHIAWVIFFDSSICYTNKSGVRRMLQLLQRNGKLPLSR